MATFYDDADDDCIEEYELIAEQERLERCYECSGYGDDYYYDSELDELICNCDDCPYNGYDEDD